MTILTACQQAAQQLSKSPPTTIFSGGDQFALELGSLANEAAADMAKAYDWRALFVLKALVGDGVTTAFAMPADYDRMPMQSALFSSGWSWQLRQFRSVDAFLSQQVVPMTLIQPGQWIILGGQMNILPAIPASRTVSYYYVAKKLVKAGDSTLKPMFTLDDDTFRLDERLLTLSLIWRWRFLKGLDYGENMKSYEIALAQTIARDKGSTKIIVGDVRFPIDLDYPFPGVIHA